MKEEKGAGDKAGMEKSVIGTAPASEGKSKDIILNLTQHKATAEQVKQGVIECQRNKDLAAILTFEDLPDTAEIQRRAEKLAFIAGKECDDCGAKRVMIGGAPFLMSALERELRAGGLEPVYAFSKRESVEKEVDGKVIKTQVFKHLGFVEVNE